MCRSPLSLTVCVPVAWCLPLRSFFLVSCSNAQIATIVGLRVKGVGKRVAEKKMRLELKESAIK